MPFSSSGKSATKCTETGELNDGDVKREKRRVSGVVSILNGDRRDQERYESYERDFHAAFAKIPTQERMKWQYGGSILSLFKAWRLLSLQITEEDSKERRRLLKFI